MPLIAQLLEKQSNHTADVALSSLKDPNMLYSLLAGAGAGGLLGAMTPTDTDPNKPLTASERRSKMFKNMALYGLGGAAAGGAGKLGYDFLTDPTMSDDSPGFGGPAGYLPSAAAGGAIGTIGSLARHPWRSGAEHMVQQGRHNLGELAKKLGGPLGMGEKLTDSHVESILTKSPTDAAQYLREAASGHGVHDLPIFQPGADGPVNSPQKLVEAIRAQEGNLLGKFRGSGLDINPAYLGSSAAGKLGPKMEAVLNRMHFNPTAQGVFRPAVGHGLLGAAAGLGVNGLAHIWPNDNLFGE